MHTGYDVLTGGAGSDHFLYESLDDSRVINGSVQDFIQDFEHGIDHLDLLALHLSAADLLVQDYTIGGANYSVVGADLNRNGIFDNGEFALSAKMSGPGFIAASDILI